ncbi:hypothetical protein, partial [Methanothrix sp.]|uniref:hypothetical protein n=1 Tax=Methanothrix sp. TaxID=90426 RepID=UPI003299D390
IDPLGFKVAKGKDAWATTGNGTVYLYDALGDKMDRAYPQSDQSHSHFAYGRIPDGRRGGYQCRLRLPEVKHWHVQWQRGAKINMSEIRAGDESRNSKGESYPENENRYPEVTHMKAKSQSDGFTVSALILSAGHRPYPS